MSDELKSLIKDLTRDKRQKQLSTPAFLVNSAFGQRTDDGQPLDVHVKHRPNNAEIFGDLEVFDDVSDDESSFEILIIEMMQKLNHGGRFRLEKALVTRGYRFVQL